MRTPNRDPDLLSEPEVADMLGLHRRTLQTHRLRRHPLVAYVVMGHRIVYRRKDVYTALEQLRVPAAHEAAADVDAELPKV